MLKKLEFLLLKESLNIYIFWKILSLSRKKVSFSLQRFMTDPRKYKDTKKTKKVTKRKYLCFVRFMKSHSGTARKLKNESKVILVVLAALSSGCTSIYHALRNRLWLSATPSATTTYLAHREQIVSIKVREFSEKLGYRNRERPPGRRRRFLLFWEDRPSYLTPAGSWVSLKDGSLAGNRISSRFRRGADRKRRNNKSVGNQDDLAFTRESKDIIKYNWTNEEYHRER